MCVSVFRNCVIHEIFCEFLQPFWYVGKQRVAAFCRGFRFYLVLDFGLAWSTGRPGLFVQHVNLTQVLDGNLSHLDFFCVRVSLSLDTVVVGEVDELEEDVG